MRYLAIFFFILIASNVHAEVSVTIENAWVKESPPGVNVNAAYMDIHNNSDKDRTLVAIQSPDFGAIEIHKTIVRDDKASMQRHESVIIRSGSVLSLAPGSWHLMLFRPTQAVMHGSYVDLSLEFADGTTQPLMLPVRRAYKR